MCAVQRVFKYCPVRKKKTNKKTLETIKINNRPQGSEEEKFLDLPVSKALRAAQETSPTRRKAEETVQESMV